MPAVEDKLLQRAGTRLRPALDAPDGLRGRYGYRPQVGALDAVDRLTSTRQCGRDIGKAAASGVDRISAQDDERHLDENIHHLVERRKRKRYRAKLVRRRYIPHGDGTRRP